MTEVVVAFVALQGVAVVEGGIVGTGHGGQVTGLKIVVVGLIDRQWIADQTDASAFLPR